MKRIIALLFLTVCMCGTAGCTKGIDRTTPIIDTENISRILCCGLPDAAEGLEVPPEDMEEMTAWLGTFTLGTRADDPLPPGTNSYWLIIEYSDGTSAKQYLDTADADGVTCYTEHDPIPQCFFEVFGDDKRDAQE